MTIEPQVEAADTPPVPLYGNRSFWGMTITQFLGAFNDNLFKQVVLLMCIDLAVIKKSGVDYQPQAQELFAWPFVLFSGFAGFLSDRLSKRGIIVTCKMLEIAIVCLGTWALSTAQHSFGAEQQASLSTVFFVLFLLGTHSAFFGPSKYGILPELVPEGQLPAANGIFLMTTFVAIIMGTVIAGFLKGFVTQRILLVGAAYVGVAAIGFGTSLLIRKTVPVRPSLKFEWSDLLVSIDTLKMFWKDRPLLMALIMYSVFWLIGGLTLPAVNAYGKLQLYASLPIDEADKDASLLNGFLVLGIASGCAWAGWISGTKIRYELVTWGCAGMTGGLFLLSFVGYLGTTGPPPHLSATIVGGLSKILLAVMGFSAGVFTVPLQVFLQSRPPSDQKGRVIGAMNLVNWIGILCSARIYAGFDFLRQATSQAHSALFGFTALFLVPVVLFYRPRETPRPNFP
jgi:acyl-[acyl-carrier-protein]-phospholipid O-acyltransferase/long-chain-fatty-acid--[acyl-carrier-protein] ligase